MRASVFFPSGNVSNEHPGAHNMFETSTEPLQCHIDVSQALFSLFVGIVEPNNLAILAERGRAGDINSISYAHSARVANDWFPLSAGRYSLPFSDHRNE